MDKADLGHRRHQFIHDLWGEGFTIVKRPADPFEIDPRLIPRGMTYQWNTEPGPIAGDAGTWRSVQHSRHPGVFAPWGTNGNIEVGGLYLCERPEEIARRANEQATTKAKQQIDDWAARAGAVGLVGEVKVGGEVRAAVGGEFEKGQIFRNDTKTIETTVGVPGDMFPYMNEVFRERDRLEAEVVRKDRTLVPGPIADKFYEAIEANARDGTPFQWWPTLRAILLPIAVENVREKHPEIPSEEKIND
jgi:hypothetical protein